MLGRISTDHSPQRDHELCGAGDVVFTVVCRHSADVLTVDALALVYGPSRVNKGSKPGPTPSDSGYFLSFTRTAKRFPRHAGRYNDDTCRYHNVYF